MIDRYTLINFSFVFEPPQLFNQSTSFLYPIQGVFPVQKFITIFVSLELFMKNCPAFPAFSKKLKEISIDSNIIDMPKIICFILSGKVKLSKLLLFLLNLFLDFRDFFFDLEVF